MFAVACKKLQASHLIPSYSFSECRPLTVNVHKVYIARAEYANVSGSEQHHLRVSFARGAIFLQKVARLLSTPLLIEFLYAFKGRMARDF